jgi:hypothetical protein
MAPTADKVTDEKVRSAKSTVAVVLSDETA